MTTADKKRLTNALKTVASDLDSKAKGFCYRNEPEYLEIRKYLVEKAEELQAQAEGYESSKDIINKKGE